MAGSEPEAPQAPPNRRRAGRRPTRSREIQLWEQGRRLVAGVDEVGRGPLAGPVVADYVSVLKAGQAEEVTGSLTATERRVVQLIAEGRSTKEIGTELGASSKTVATHPSHIFRKLDVSSVAEVVRYAIREGLSPPE